MNCLNKLIEKRVEKRIALIFGQRTQEQEEMFQEQLRIKDALGFEHGNDTQNWLRIHQIMLDHDNRIKALEVKK